MNHPFWGSPIYGTPLGGTTLTSSNGGGLQHPKASEAAGGAAGESTFGTRESTEGAAGPAKRCRWHILVDEKYDELDDEIWWLHDENHLWP